MKHYKELLLNKLIESGWELLEKKHGTDWWLEESWKLRSTRQVWGYEIYVLFLVDPMYEAPGKDSPVWAVSAALEFPRERPVGDEGVVTMDLVKGKFDQKLESFVYQLNSHRETVGL